MNDVGETSTRVPTGRFLNLGEAKPRREEEGLGWEATRRKFELAGALVLLVSRIVVDEPSGVRIVISGLGGVASIFTSCHPF